MPRKISRFEANAPSLRLPTGSPGAVSKSPVLSSTPLGAVTSAPRAQLGISTAQVVAGAVQSLLECGKAYFNYLEQREITYRMEIWSRSVIETAREKTRQMEIQSRQLVAVAQEKTRQVESNAQQALAEIQDRQQAREARMEVVRGFTDLRQEYEKQFWKVTEDARRNLSVEERVYLNRERDVFKQRLLELDTALVNLAATL